MNAYTTREELALLPSDRVSHPEHYLEARGERKPIFARLAGRVADYLKRQRVLSELNGLSDRELADIGLTRVDLSSLFGRGYAGRRG